MKKWKEFFPQKDMRLTPSFDGRVVCYPSNVNLRDYLAWRQVDCHINNQYNTCFWMLVLKKDKTKKEAQDILKGTQTQDKNELLFQQFDINYSNLPAIFRKGSCVFRDKVEEIVKLTVNCDPVKRSKKKVVVAHCDVIGDNFWKEHPWILDE
ncbi:tRNA(His) guanylyltransferase [Thalictrum thalictroides]|uniref:tRNA(His) guanylyltransferase n=1 Tax=Thalictrum thalictroides TaxID=46969 RepID=A0A7J6UTG2_THATH|nr:tRNA(His) guanylyltransferase [Thalictrum thalictroides]